MPRPRRGLGQGLDALVGEMQQHVADLAPQPPAAPNPAPPCWEYACLQLPSNRKRRGRRRVVRLWFSHRGNEALVRPRPTVLRPRDRWAALGLLGAEGWELVVASRRHLFFKRPAGPRC